MNRVKGHISIRAKTIGRDYVNIQLFDPFNIFNHPQSVNMAGYFHLLLLFSTWIVMSFLSSTTM